MVRLPSSLWLTVASVATLWLGASCHLVGGTDGLFIEEPSSGVGGGSSGTGGSVGGSSSSTTSTGTGAGGNETCVPETCPGEDTQCEQRACVNGICDMTIEPTGTACTDGGGLYCDGAGSCVECNSFDDCGGNPCQDNLCVDASCNDQVKDGDETGVDCGGSCGACPNNQGCIVSADCLSWFCSAGTCQPCIQHNQCVDGDSYCDLPNGVCRPKKSFGDKCVEDYECKLGAPYCSCWPITGCICSWAEN